MATKMFYASVGLIDKSIPKTAYELNF